jgi:hypothetical protein
MTFKKNSLVRELSNEDYHGASKWYSSSQLKEALIDIETFYRLYVTKELSKESTTAMDIGTYYHTAILEPEKLKEECVVWDGVRRGKAWVDFLDINKGKTIITSKEVDKANNLIDATRKDSETMRLLNAGEAELSCFAELEGLKIRVRADWIDVERGFIMDLKSTSGNAKNFQKAQKTIENYHYDLSAALYLDAFNQVLAKEKKPLLTDFYWAFASKDACNAQVFKASEKMIELGRLKYKRALNNIKKSSASGWNFPSTIIEVAPPRYIEELWQDEDAQPIYETIEPMSGNGSDLL